jgi:hypothetical protein
MFAEVGKLPNLVTLCVVPIASVMSGARNCCVPVKALELAIDNNLNELERLHFDKVKLVGDREEFRALATSIEKRSSLCSVRLACGCREQDWNDDTGRYDVATVDADYISPLDSVVSALGSIDSLGTVHLEDGVASGDLTKDTIVHLGSLSDLVDLSLLTYKLTDDLLEALARHLTLELVDVRLSCRCLGKIGSKALGDIVKDCTFLDVCHFSIHEIQGDSDPNQILRGVMGAIGKSGLSTVFVDVATPHTDVLLGKQLAYYWKGTATTIICMLDPFSHLYIFVTGPENTRAMLRGNYGIQNVVLRRITCGGHFVSVKDSEIDFLLKANKLGRGRIFHERGHCGEVDDEISWMALFEATDNDLTGIFYLVKSHPLEITEMLLNDCSENMTPTTKVLKRALFQNNERHKKRMKRELDGVSAKLQANAESFSQIQIQHQATMDFLGGLQATQSTTLEAVGKLNEKVIKHNDNQQSKENALFWYKTTNLLLSLSLVAALAAFKLERR